MKAGWRVERFGSGKRPGCWRAREQADWEVEVEVEVVVILRSVGAGSLSRLRWPPTLLLILGPGLLELVPLSCNHLTEPVLL